MQIIRGAEADAELKAVSPVEDIDAGAGSYPYLRLTAENFELLAYALFKGSKPPGAKECSLDDVAIMARGADAGRDLVLSYGGTIAGVVQCKRLESSMSLPAVFRELSKLILYPVADSKFPTISTNCYYYLALAHEPANTVIDFFSRPIDIIEDKKVEIENAVGEVLESYETLSDLKAADARKTVLERLPTLNFRLIRPGDLDLWLARQRDVAPLFFHHRMVIDNSYADRRHAEVMARLEVLTRRLDEMNEPEDVDLGIIKGLIEGTPESHRVAMGFASCFGYPREMFAGDRNLRKRVGRIAEMANELNRDFTDWMFEQAQTEASRICHLPEAFWSVRPFARQIASAFLASVTRDAVGRAVSGQVMDEIVAKVSGRNTFADDEARMAQVREELLENGKRYLQADYSNVVGEGDLLEMKMKLIAHMMTGIDDERVLRQVMAEGERILWPHLVDAATRLRKLCAQSPCIVLMGTTGIDSPEMVKRMAETVKALESLVDTTGAA